MDTSGSWQQKRDQLMQRIAELRQQGICYVCHDLQVSSLLTGQEIIFQNDLFRVVLDLYPRMPGHTIVVYKPHRKGFQGPPDPLERVTRVALVHVVALEEIPVAS